MKELGITFGNIIALLLPGFIFMFSVAPLVPTLSNLLVSASKSEATVGAFFFVLLAALALGLMLSALRWLVVDRLLFRIPWPKRWPVTTSQKDFGKLKDPGTYTAFIAIVENHYNYYQYYANSFAAIAAATGIAVEAGNHPTRGLWVGIVVAASALLLAARDALKNYHKRAGELLGEGGLP